MKFVSRLNQAANAVLIGLCLMATWGTRANAQQTFVPNATGTYSWTDAGNWSPSFPVFPDGQNATAVFIGLSVDAIRTVQLNKNITLGTLTLINPSQQSGYGVTIDSGGDGGNSLYFVSFGSNAKIENRIGAGLQDSSINTQIDVPVVLGANLDVYGDQRRNNLTGMNLAGGIVGSADRVFTKKATEYAGSSTAAVQANVTLGASPNFDGKIIVEGGGIHISGSNSLAHATGIDVRSGGQFVIDNAPAQFNLAAGASLLVSGAGKSGGFGPQGALRYQDGNNTSTFASPIQLRDQGATIFVNADDPASGAVGTLSLTSPVTNGAVAAQLTKSGDGVLVLAAAAGNTYAGGTNVAAGTLRISNTSGSATGAGAVVVAAGAALQGSGIVAGAVNIAGGATLAPGIPAANAGIGVLTINNNVQFASTSKLAIDLASPAANDLLQVGGTAALAGTLELHLTNDFQAALGDTFTVMTYATHTGDFDSYANTYAGNYLQLVPHLTAGALTLTARPALDGDVSLDGVVNAQDLAQTSSSWLTAGPRGDANGDGVVNAQDLAIISSHWLNVFSPAGGSGVAVPEPATAAMAVSAIVFGWAASSRWKPRGTSGRRSFVTALRASQTNVILQLD